MERIVAPGRLQERVAQLRAAGRVALVPTMGALHEGHLSLVREARRHAEAVVVSIFVNPTQFAPGEDLAAYPRDLDGDEAALGGLGALAPEVVFAPEVEQIYPRPPATTVHVDGLTERLCGAARPGHFDGVATVVTLLHNLVGPDVAVYGRKDFQQLQVVRRVVADLHAPVEVVGAPIVREPDGLAMSSRNRYLDAGQRRDAVALSRALRGAVLEARRRRARGRPVTPAALHDAAAGALSGLDVEYLEVVDPETLAPPGVRREQLLVALAVHVGPARLIDNVVVGDHDDEWRLLRATGGARPAVGRVATEGAGGGCLQEDRSETAR